MHYSLGKGFIILYSLLSTMEGCVGMMLRKPICLILSFAAEPTELINVKTMPDLSASEMHPQNFGKGVTHSPVMVIS